MSKVMVEVREENDICTETIPDNCLVDPRPLSHVTVIGDPL